MHIHPHALFYLSGVPRRFSEFRSVSIVGEHHLPAPEVCRVLPPASCSSASPAVRIPLLKHFSPSGICWHAYLSSTLTTSFTGFLAIFIITIASTVMAHSRYSLGAYTNWISLWLLLSIHLSLPERNVVWLWGGRGGVSQKGVREKLRAKRITLLGRLYKLNWEGHELSPYPELPLFLLPVPLLLVLN